MHKTLAYIVTGIIAAPMIILFLMVFGILFLKILGACFIAYILVLLSGGLDKY
jgi:hypothetical protein